MELLNTDKDKYVNTLTHVSNWCSRPDSNQSEPNTNRLAQSISLSHCNSLPYQTLSKLVSNYCCRCSASFDKSQQNPILNSRASPIHKRIKSVRTGKAGAISIIFCDQPNPYEHIQIYATTFCVNFGMIKHLLIVTMCHHHHHHHH
jgi:hypothetical protein